MLGIQTPQQYVLENLDTAQLGAFAHYLSTSTSYYALKCRCINSAGKTAAHLHCRTWLNTGLQIRLSILQYVKLHYNYEESDILLRLLS